MGTVTRLPNHRQNMAQGLPSAPLRPTQEWALAWGSLNNPTPEERLEAAQALAKLILGPACKG